MGDLLTLPPELRLEIYRYLRPETIRRSLHPPRPSPPRDTAILFACRQIHAEASQVFQASTEWHFHMLICLHNSHVIDCLTSLAAVGTSKISVLTLTFWYGHFHDVKVDITSAQPEIMFQRQAGQPKPDEPDWTMAEADLLGIINRSRTSNGIDIRAWKRVIVRLEEFQRDL